jgi:hypothetical protein
VILVDSLGSGRLEVVIQDGCAGFSVECSPEELAVFIDQAESLEPMRAFRRQRSVEAAKEAASHHARASRR